jgi:hypothetical protein
LRNETYFGVQPLNILFVEKSAIRRDVLYGVGMLEKIHSHALNEHKHDPTNLHEKNKASGDEREAIVGRVSC